MKPKNVFLFSLLSMGTCLTSNAQLCPPNMDFELGTTADWTYYKGTVATGPVFTLPTSLPGPPRLTLTSGTGTDVYGGFPVVCDGSYSFKLGKDTVLYCAEAASYNIHVPATGVYNLVYHYAAVLEDAGHTPSNQPRLEINATDSATGTALPSGSITIMTSTVPGFIHSTAPPPAPSDVYYKPWTTGSISLAGYGGHTVMIKFIAGDCGTGGHFGYGYIDMNCIFSRGALLPCKATSTTLEAPIGYASYSWKDSLTFGTSYGTTQTITASTPQTYAIIMTPYAGHGSTDTMYTTLLPSMTTPPITGSTTVGVSHTISLTDAITGGTWSSSTTTIATVSPSGVVTGVATGSDTIFYAAGGGLCDTYTVITVTSTLGAINTNGTGTINLFPNPAKSLLSIKWENLETDNANVVISN